MVLGLDRSNRSLEAFADKPAVQVCFDKRRERGHFGLVFSGRYVPENASGPEALHSFVNHPVHAESIPLFPVVRACAISVPFHE